MADNTNDNDSTGWQTIGPKPKFGKFSAKERERKRLSAEAEANSLQAYYESQGLNEKRKLVQEREEKLLKSKQSATVFGTRTKFTSGSAGTGARAGEGVGDEEIPKVRRVSFEQKQKIVRLRQKKGLTQKQAALQAGVTHNVYESYESGKAVFENATFVKILTSLGRLPDKVESSDDN